MFGTATTFVFFQMVLQMVPSVMREGLVVDLSLTDSGFGGLSSSFYYPYIILQVPAGILVSRFGVRRVLITSAILCTAASFLFAMSRSADSAEATRILMGLGAAPTVVCAMTLAAQWFPQRWFALLAALTEVAGMTGAALGQEVLGLIVERSGWRAGMTVCGVFSMVLMFLVILFVKNRAQVNAETWPKTTDIRRLLYSWPVVAPGVAGGLVSTAGMSFGMLWGVSYFQAYHQMSLSAASICSSFYFWGCLPGMLGLAWLSIRLQAPALLLAIGAAGSAVAMALILFVLHGQTAQSAGMFLLGLFNSSYILSFTMVKDRTPHALSGVAMGLTNMLIMGIGGLVFQPLIGILAHACGEQVPAAAPLSSIIVAQVLAVVLLMRIRGDHPRPAAAG